jgi:ABC-type glycerol-3-phosphate transport system substrate-binding protein
MPINKNRVWKRAWLLWAALFLAGTLAACTALTPPQDDQASPTAALTPSDSEATPAIATEAVGPVTLSLWLPPEFNPSGGNLAATLMQARITEFEENHPNTRVEVRLKAETGAGNLYEALTAAQKAAPLALPDLVLMPSSLLPQVAVDGLVRPLDDLMDEEAGEDWYPFAQDMLTYADQVYCIPFVGDGLVLIYRPTAIETAPGSWQAVLDGQLSLGFAAADANSVFTLSQLLALEEELPPLGRFPEFAPETLSAVFEFYVEGNSRSIFPFWLTQFTTHEQSWLAFAEGRLPMVADWSSRFLVQTEVIDLAAAPIPTPNGEAFTLVKGWGWALTTPNEDRVELAAELANWLSDPAFLAQWSAAAGYLPARSSSLAAWAPDARQALASQILPNARIMPDSQTRNLLGGHISEAVIGLLKQEISPSQATENVLEGLEERSETP